MGPVEHTDRRRFVLAFAGVFLIWLLLVGTLDPSEVLAGLVVSAVTAAVSAPYLGVLDGIRLRPSLPLHLARFLGTFLVALVKANLDVARRVLSPALPIRPAFVEVETRLTSRFGKLLLANSITLTPGTLTVDVLEDRLLVHWIDVPPGVDLDAATRTVAADFERDLREVFW
jgi:multicomponent Na+:H+ antiporter subunit E